MSSQFVKLPLSSGGGGGGGSSWGSITGTLSNQTDLQGALNSKLSLSGGAMSGNISMESSVQSTITRTGINNGIVDGNREFGFVPPFAGTMSAPFQIKDFNDTLLGTIVFNPAIPGLEYIAESGSALPALINIGGLPLFALATGTNLTYLSISFLATYSLSFPLKITYTGQELVNNKITGLADGTSSRDAVNLQQMSLAMSSLANNGLTNLTITSINQDLIPNAFDPMTMTGKNIGSASLPWLNGYFAFVNAAVYGNATGLDTVLSAGSSNSIKFVDTSLATSSNGYVWTLQDNTTGRGAWAAAGGGGGGANTTLSNLTSTTINQNLESYLSDWRVGSGDVSSSSDSGQVWFKTGNNSGTGSSGRINLFTGVAMSGPSSSSGNIDILTGPATFMSGNISLVTAGSAALRGNIVLAGRNVDASSSIGYFRVPVRSGNPADLENGAIWYDTSTNKLRAYINGVAVDLQVTYEQR